jgi:O-antigen/teichoic acid export membrane protein
VQLGAQGVQLLLMVLSGAALARLITPGDFGLAGMAATLTSVAMVLRDFGMPMATVQRAGIRDLDVTGLFWLGLRLNLILAAGLIVAGPAVAAFYDEPRVTELVIAVALSNLVGAAGLQHEALLIRQMRYVALRAIDLSSLAIGMLAGFAYAWAGGGYRALMLQTFVIAAVRTLGLWRACRWRPASWRTAPSEGHASLASFGWYHTGAKLLRHLSQNVDQVVVGYLFGARQLGFYDSAYRWSITTSQQIYTPLQNVAVSGLSRLQHDREAFRVAARRGFLPVFSAIIPALVLLALEARPVILLLLGPQWEPSVPLFRMLCVGAIANALAKTVNWLYLAEGRTRRQMRWGFVTLPVFVIAVLVGSSWGPLGVATGFAVANWLVAIPEVLYCLRGSHLSLADYTAAAGRPVVAAALAAAVALVTFGVSGDLSIVSLVLRSAVFLGVYAATWFLLPGGRAAASLIVTLIRSIPVPRNAAR